MTVDCVEDPSSYSYPLLKKGFQKKFSSAAHSLSLTWEDTGQTNSSNQLAAARRQQVCSTQWKVRRLLTHSTETS